MDFREPSEPSLDFQQQQQQQQQRQQQQKNLEILRNYSLYNPITAKSVPPVIDESEESIEEEEEEEEEVEEDEEEEDEEEEEEEEENEEEENDEDDEEENDEEDEDDEDGGDVASVAEVEEDEEDEDEEDDDEDEEDEEEEEDVCGVPLNIPYKWPLVYPPLEIGQTVFAMALSNLQPWDRYKIKSIVDNFCVKVINENGENILTKNEVAFTALNPVRFHVGCRVIAKLTDLNSNHVDEFYAGIVAEPPKMPNGFRYLIFFDNGLAQYRQHRDIRLTAFDNNIVTLYNAVHHSSREFIKCYLKSYPIQQMVKLTNNQSVLAKYQNQWQMAKVLEVDASVVKLYFTDFNHTEWIYRGSLRLNNILVKHEDGGDVARVAEVKEEGGEDEDEEDEDEEDEEEEDDLPISMNQYQ